MHGPSRQAVAGTALLAAALLLVSFPGAAQTPPIYPDDANFLARGWLSPDGDGEAFGAWIPFRWGDTDRGDLKVQDPSNGGTSPQNYVNVSSGCTDEDWPSIFWYYDSTNQIFMFRWRVEQIAHTYATGANAGRYSAVDPWKSAQWTVFFDTDGDGYREFAMHVDGSSGDPSNPIDRLVAVYSNTPGQSIDYVNDSNVHKLADNPTAFVDSGTSRILNFQNSVNPGISWPNGAAETVWDYGTTRARLVRHPPTGTLDCYEYFIDYQIPLAMLDATPFGGPAVTEDTPLAVAFATANSLQNPVQKDVILNGNCQFTGDPNGIISFGNPMTFGGGDVLQPMVTEVTATGCPATLTATVVAPTVCSAGVLSGSVASVEFFSYRDTNGNGLADDGSSWASVGLGSDLSLGQWTRTWDSTALPAGAYLIGVRATDDSGRVTWSYDPAPGSPPDYPNPDPPGLVWASPTRSRAGGRTAPARPELSAPVETSPERSGGRARGASPSPLAEAAR